MLLLGEGSLTQPRLVGLRRYCVCVCVRAVCVRVSLSLSLQCYTVNTRGAREQE